MELSNVTVTSPPVALSTVIEFIKLVLSEVSSKLPLDR